MGKNHFSGPITLLKSKCAEPCGNGGGGGTGGIDYQPQIDKINEHLNQNDQKLTNLDVELANIRNDYASKTLLNNVKDSLEQQMDSLSDKVNQDIKNINNDLNNNYVTKIELSDEVDVLNKRIDGITGGGTGGIDYQPQIDALKEKDKQIEQKVIDNSGKVQANEQEINNIKTNFVTKTELGTTTATIMQDCNDYTDEKIKQVITDIDTNRNLITNLDGRVQTLEQNQGTGGGTNSKLSDAFVILSVSIHDGNVTVQAFNPDNNQTLNGVTWDIRYKNAYFRNNSFSADNAEIIAPNNQYKYNQYDDAIIYTNAKIKVTWNNKSYITGLKQTLMSFKDVDYVSGANLRLIAKKD